LSESRRFGAEDSRLVGPASSATAGENLRQQAIYVSIDVQAQVAAGNFVILSSRIDAGAPVDDLIGASIDGTETHAVREGC
jgi:hypothetical protein